MAELQAERHSVNSIYGINWVNSIYWIQYIEFENRVYFYVTICLLFNFMQPDMTRI